MSKEEQAQLNFLLTKLRYELNDFIVKSGDAISPFTEMKYEELIKNINEIMELSLMVGGEEND